MKQPLLLFFVFLGSILTLSAQSAHTCQPILDKVKALVAERSIKAQEALNHLNICDRKNGLILERNSLQNQINRINQEEKERAQHAEKKAVKSKNAEIDARLATVREQIVSDSLKLRNYNMRQALSTMQENPSMAWSIVEHLRGSTKDYKDLAEVVYSIASDPKNEAYLKHLFFDEPILATAWNEKNELLVADASGVIKTYTTKGETTDSFEFARPLQYQQMVGIFSRDGGYFFHTKGIEDSTLVIVNMAEKKAILTLEAPERIYKIGFSPNLLYLAVGMHKKIRFYNLSQQPPVYSDLEFSGVPSILTINDSGILAMAETDSPLHFYDLKADGVSIETFNPVLKGLAVRSASFTIAPDVLLVGGTGFDAALCVWNGEEYRPMNGHINNITAFDIDYNKKLVATGSSDKTVRLWNIDDTKREMAILKGHQAQIRHIAFSPDGQYLATADIENNIRLWRTHGKKKGGGTLRDRVLVTATTFSPLDDQILAGGIQGSIGIFDTLGTLKELYHNPSGDSVRCLAFIHENQFISGSSKGHLCIWNKKDTIPTKTINVRCGAVSSISVSPDRKKIIAGYENGHVRVFNAKLDSLGAFHSGNAIKAVTFSGENIVVADSRGYIRFYDKNYIEQNPNKPLKKSAIHVAAVSKSGRYMLTSNNHDVRLWDLEFPKYSFDLEDAHANRVSGLAFSPDERFMLTASWDNTAIVWSINGKKMYKVATSASVMSIAASGNGRHFATGSGTLDVWRMPDVYLEECVESASINNLIKAGVLMNDLTFYERSNNLDLLRKAAQQFGSIASWRTADTLYALVLDKIEMQLRATKKTNRNTFEAFENEADDWLSLKNDVQLDRAEMRIEAARSSQETAHKEAFIPLIQSCKDPNELVAYAEYSFAHREWKALKSACERHRAITATNAIWASKYLFYANTMLHNKQAKVADLTNTADLDELGRLALFFTEQAGALPDSLMDKKATLAQAAYRIMVRYDQLHANDPATLLYLTDQCLNYGWYQLLSGQAAGALKIIAEGQALCRRHVYPVADSLLQMNRAHALLLTGQFEAAATIYQLLAPLKFIDNRYATFGTAFLDDIRLLREADTYPEIKGKVIGTRYRNDVLRIEEILKGKPN